MSAQAVTLDVTPGSLADALKALPDAATETSLTLNGSMDQRDFSAIAANMPALKSLDLRGVTIEAYAPVKVSGSTTATYPADQLPAHALFSMGLTDVVLPASLKTIGDGALADNAFTSITIPEGVTSIGSHAFYGSKNLKTISLPASVAAMGDYAFASCDALTDANLSASAVKALPANSFASCAQLSNVTLPASLTVIGQNAFASTPSLASVNLPETVTTIGENAFMESGLREVELPEATTTVGDYAFARCGELLTATFSASDMTLGEGIFFYDPAFTALHTPSALKVIPDYTFTGGTAFRLNDDSLEGTERVGKYALMGNTTETLDLGVTLLYLGDGAMEGMNKLESVNAIDLGANVPELGEDVFKDIDQQAIEVNVNNSDRDAWLDADQWNQFKITGTTLVADNVVVSNDVKAWLSGSMLNITSSEPIESARVYTSDGRILASATPNASTASLSLPAPADNVYVVVVKTPAGNYTFKLIK